MGINAISVNLKRLRIVNGLSQSEAATAAGISRVAYSNIENGKAEPRVKNLERLAAALKVSIFDIVASIPEISSVRFRCKMRLSNQEKEARSKIVTDIAVWLNDFQELEKALAVKNKGILVNSCDVQEKINREEIIKCAVKVREKLGLKENEPINDICGLLESAGIKIHLFKTDLCKIYGLSVSEGESRVAIGVNTAQGISVERQIFTVAHELGHLLLHTKSFNVNELEENKTDEDEADLFASHFLMSRKAFQKIWDENKGLHWIDTILHVKRIFKVSYRTIIARLIDEHGVPSDFWRIFCVEFKKRYHEDLRNHKEPLPLDDIDFVEDKLRNLVRKGIEREQITVSRGAEILKMSVDEMRDFLNSWAILDDKSCHQ